MHRHLLGLLPRNHKQSQSLRGPCGEPAALGQLPFTALLFGMFALVGPASAGESNAAPDLVTGPAIAASSAELAPADLARAEAALERLAAESGSLWRAFDWAPATLTPRVAYGTGLDLGTPIGSALEAETAARRFVAAEPELFQTEDSRLTLFRAQSGLGKWSVHLREQVDGYEILGSKVTVMMTEEGRLAAFGATTFPMIQHAEPPVLAREEAGVAVREYLETSGFLAAGVALSRDQVQGPYLLPVSSGQGLPGHLAIEGRTVYRVALATLIPPASFEVDIDAVNGHVLARRDVLRSIDLSGTARGSFEDPGYCDGAAIGPAARLFVDVPGVGTATTAVDGTFTLTYGGASPLPINAELKGAVVDIWNSVGAQAAYSGTITPGTPFTIEWNDSNSQADERDTYFHAEGTHRLLQSVDPGWHDLDFPLPANVNVQNSCNANWDGNAINMYREAGGCANTGRIGDVVAHEYGHAITDYMYGPTDPPSDMHEGNSDVMGTFRSNNPIVGPGFYLGDCVNGLRTVDNDMRWPDDIQGEGHHDGLIVAGFMWDTRERLIQQLGTNAGSTLALTLWQLSRTLGLPYSQPEQALWTLLVDDNDGNLDNGTPHYDAICPSAAHHGFSCPERFANVVVHHIPLEYGDSPNHQAIPVDADMYSLAGPLAPDSLSVYWRPSALGSFQRVPMSLVAGQTYRGLIPGQNVGKGVDYYIVARDQAGNRLRRPASGFNTFLVVFAHDNFESASSWTVGAPGDNATTGVWEQVDPVGTKLGPQVLQPESDATADPGKVCWITQQYTGGQPYLSDADGTTTLLSPVYDLTGMTWALVRYNRWFQSLSSATGQLDIGVSYNGGASWTRLELLTAAQGAPAWKAISKNITPQIGSLGLTRFRVVMLGQPLPSVDEAGFDDFALLASNQGSAADAPASAPREAEVSLRLASALPSSATAALEWELPRAMSAHLALYAVDGSLVRTLARGQAAAGTRRFEWDGRDESGQRVGAGLYFARLDTPAGVSTRRVLLAR